MQAGDVERVERFLLDLVVIDAGVLADEHLRHRVGEIGLTGRADVALDDPAPAALAPATISVRGCAITVEPSAPDTKMTWIGVSSTAPSGR